jgi:hypothetical protein
MEVPVAELSHLIAGFTGTRDGLTSFQRSLLMRLLTQITPSGLHHGDCIGADAEAHGVCCSLQIPISIHPPDKETYQAHCANYRNGYMVQELFGPKPYLARNHDIVDKCDYLIACVKGPEELVGSGTWATIRYARTHDVPVFIFYPDGLVDSPYEGW